MAYSSQDIVDFLIANPGLTDAQLAGVMATAGVSPSQIAAATGADEGTIAARVAATLPPNEAVLMGDTYVQAINQTIGSGEDQQVGGLQNVITYKADENKVGGGYNQYTPTGELERTGKQQEVNATKDFLKFAALAGGGLYGLNGGFEGLFGGGGGAGAAGATGTAGMTTAELAQLDLALGGAGGTAGAESLAAALSTGAPVATLTNLTGGSGLLTGAEAGITAQSVADKLAADAALNPAVVTPTGTPTGGGGGGGVPTTTTTVPTTTTTVPTTTTTVPTNLSSVLTPAVVKAATGLLGPLVLSKALTPTGTSTPMPTSAIPTQGVPLNSADYFKAIQANYNQLLPLSNKDVASPLAAWYNSQYGA